MKFPLLALLLLTLPAPAAAQSQFSLRPNQPVGAAPASLIGTWGTASQCAELAAGGSDNPALMPYQISSEWIRQGFLYCILAWRGEAQIDGETRYFADAQCGEDDLRDYRISLELRQRRLQIRWSDDFSTTALQACAAD